MNNDSIPNRNWEERAQYFIEYFRFAVENSPHNKWKLGLNVAEEWARLIQQQASANEVMELLQTIEENKHEGSGWYALRLEYYSWAKENNFPIPKIKDFPGSFDNDETQYQKDADEEWDRISRFRPSETDFETLLELSRHLNWDSLPVKCWWKDITTNHKDEPNK